MKRVSAAIDRSARRWRADTIVSARLARALPLIVVVSVLGVACIGQAQEHRTRFETPAYGTEWSTMPQYHPSSENFTLELRVGTYQPDIGHSFSAFNGDLGPMIGGELDAHVIRIPYFGVFAIGAAFGWAEWSGPATSTVTTGNVGSTGLSLVMVTVLAALRIDALAHYANVPLVITPKLGVDGGYWQTGVSGASAVDGFTAGIHWGLQLALELDFLDPRAAHRLDNAWGINHSCLFFEIYGADLGPFTARMLPLGTPITWTAGLGFTF